MSIMIIKKIYRLLFITGVSLIFFLLPVPVKKYEPQIFRVVLDPGHGGVCKYPISKYGDRYDTLTGTYIEEFKEGAAFRNLEEHKIVYEISEKVEKILKDCSPEGDFNKFREILKKYSDDFAPKVIIRTYMGRRKSLSESEKNNLEDPNAEFRLFDFPDKNGEMKPGRLSRMNSLKPHLIVSLHLAFSGPPEYRGMNPILAAPPRLLSSGLKYLRGEINDKSFFYKDPHKDWFIENMKRPDFSWFLNDTALYYTNYPLNSDLSVDRSGYRGYRYNMVSWPYRDDAGWEKEAISHKKDSRYSISYKDFVPDGKFWDREKSVYESYRRDNGEEGFGGDNAYAAYEMIRFIMYSLNLRGIKNKNQVAGKSYVSTWIVPIHVNAINPFIELGYLIKPWDRYLLVEKQNEIAEGIAVAIYSMIAGLNVKDKNVSQPPKGKSIDFKKYMIGGNGSYFDLPELK